MLVAIGLSVADLLIRVARPHDAIQGLSSSKPTNDGNNSTARNKDSNEPPAKDS